MTTDKPNYKVWDNQNNYYFHSGNTFKSLREIKKTLLDFHSVDIEKSDLKLWKKETLANICEFFGWQVHNAKTEKEILLK